MGSMDKGNFYVKHTFNTSGVYEKLTFGFRCWHVIIYIGAKEVGDMQWSWDDQTKELHGELEPGEKIVKDGKGRDYIMVKGDAGLSVRIWAW